MTLAIVAHPAYAEHDTGEHPENARRYERTLAHLAALNARLVTPEPIDPAVLALVHPPSHGERIAAFCAAGGGRIDEDTVASPKTYEVALLSAGGAVEAVRQVLSGEASLAAALCRPPGHHALPEETMGFCFFANAAIAARYAQTAFGLERVAILDWDLHHGNGTEAIFYADPSVLYLSTHQHPNWPGTGAAQDIGVDAGRGYNVNVPLPHGVGDAGYLRTFREILEPIVQAFAPQLLILSAGFDAHWRDPLGKMGLTVSGYATLAREVGAWAEASGSKLALLMEGGYDLDALAHCMTASLQALRGEPVTDALGPSPYEEPREGLEQALAEARAALAPYWPALAAIA
ncbi:MAG TPA: histone deacetylase [Oscillatoriaceae cyanobacterium]